MDCAEDLMFDCESALRLAVIRVAVVAAPHKDPNCFSVFAVDHGVREVVQRLNSPQLVRRRAEIGKLEQQLHDAVELVQESTSKLGAAFLAIEARGFEEIELGSPV